MARPIRIEYPGALYHLASPGNAQEDIFQDDFDPRRVSRGTGRGGQGLLLLAHFAHSLAAARRRYVTFVEQSIRTPSPWKSLQGQVPLGEQAMLRKVAPQAQVQGPFAQGDPERPALWRASAPEAGPPG